MKNPCRLACALALGLSLALLWAPRVAAQATDQRFDSVRRDAATSPAPLRQRLYLEAIEGLLPLMQVHVAERHGRLRLVQAVEVGGR